MDLSKYSTENFFDEMFVADGLPRREAQALVEQLMKLPFKELVRRQKAAELTMFQMGITFNVYGARQGVEKIIPIDIIPRIIESKSWEKLERGLVQRIHALNLFIDDVYNAGKIFKSKVIPPEMVLASSTYLKQCKGLHPPDRIWIHITGTDLIRDQAGDFFVLEDNLRCPSGVSYLLENRNILKRTFALAFKTMRVRPVSDYPEWLLATLGHIAKPSTKKPKVVLLTPGPYNAAYFEHAYLAQQMGVQLVEGRDLLVDNDVVYMRTTRGFKKVEVIYRRIDDEFLDPQVFRKDSILGVPGLFSAYLKGNVALANAPGTGVADDKAIYAYTPQIIKYYLGEDAIIPIVPTYICDDKKQRDYVLQNLDKLVVKAVNLSGGYGMLIGPKSTKAQRKRFAELIKKSPRDHIAQPTIALSRSPTLASRGIEGRHVDCRPYVLYGKSIHVIPGGLTRVALKKGSLVVNSSQGGGSKDTWVVAKEKTHHA